MSFRLMYYCELALLIGVAAAICLHYLAQTRRRMLYSKGKRFGRIRELLWAHFDQQELGSRFKDAGIGMTSVQYQLVRCTVLCGWAILRLWSSLESTGSFRPTAGTCLLIAGAILLTSPRPTWFGKRSPFQLALAAAARHHRRKQTVEIYRAVSQLKNLVLTKQNEPPGSVYILEQLRKFTVTTRPVFNRMMSLWTIGRREEACQYFQQAIPTKEAEELSHLLNKLDRLNPAELKNQLLLIQEMVKGERRTEKLKADQKRSHAIYAIVIAACFCAMVNFIVVVFYIDFLKQMMLITD